MPPLAASSLPRARSCGAGEGALLVAEELALEERLGDGRAVDRDERPAPPVRQLVDAPREHLLAGAALADERDGDVFPRDGLDDLIEATHLG